MIEKAAIAFRRLSASFRYAKAVARLSMIRRSPLVIADRVWGE
jgi:hypothetical protein